MYFNKIRQQFNGAELRLFLPVVDNSLNTACTMGKPKIR